MRVDRTPFANIERIDRRKMNVLRRVSVLPEVGEPGDWVAVGSKTYAWLDGSWFLLSDGAALAASAVELPTNFGILALGDQELELGDNLLISEEIEATDIPANYSLLMHGDEELRLNTQELILQDDEVFEE